MPDPEYPIPEVMHEEVKPASFLECAVATLTGAPIPALERAGSQKTRVEDDSNLYSLRDFSI